MPLLQTRVTLEEFAEQIVRRASLELRVCMPAKVVLYVPPAAAPKPTPPRAVLQIDLMYAREGRLEDVDVTAGETFTPAMDPRLPGEIVGPYPLVTCPVHYPGPWGMWSRGPLLPGELGKLVFADRSLDSWQLTGGGTKPIDPVFSHCHGFNLHDAWFEPGIRSGLSMAAGPPGTAPSVIDPVAWQIGTADGLSGLKITAPGGGVPVSLELTTAGPLLTLDAATTIKHGAAATKPFALAPALIEIFTALAADIGTWVPVTEAALKAAMMLPTGTVGKILALIGQIAAVKNLGE